VGRMPSFGGGRSKMPLLLPQRNSISSYFSSCHPPSHIPQAFALRKFVGLCVRAVRVRACVQPLSSLSLSVS
jgi:hypothetical protein